MAGTLTFSRRSRGRPLKVWMVVPVSGTQRLGRHAKIASSLVDIDPTLHEPGRSSVAANLRPIVPATDGGPGAPQFTDGSAKVVNDVGDAVLGIFPIPAA